MWGFAEQESKKDAPTRPLSEVLLERGYIYQHSAPVKDIADAQKRTLYLGIDPSADSMHVGNLMGLLVLRHFLEHGHRVILLTGGGTGMIGDPGGKSEERNLLDEDTLARNSKAVAAQIRTIFGSSDFIEENNAKWLRGLKLLDFLRDIGKHFTINSMIKKDTVKTRLDAESPISFTEFSYALLQGYDFLHLNEAYGCDVQVGGSDQWSNILSGVEFIRRKAGREVYALTWPLLINKSTGKKFGKSESGAVWLDPAKTTPFEFYQFWFNSSDADVEEYLLKMTLLPKTEVATVMSEQQKNPSSRPAQKKLAWEVTALVHGENEANKARDFDSMPTTPAGKLRDIVKDISMSELRRLVEQGAVVSTITGKKIESIDELVSNDTIRIGKHRFLKVE